MMELEDASRPAVVRCLQKVGTCMRITASICCLWGGAPAPYWTGDVLLDAFKTPNKPHGCMNDSTKTVLQKWPPTMFPSSAGTLNGLLIPCTGHLQASVC